MKRKAGLVFITGGCHGGLIIGVLNSEKPLYSSSVTGLCTDASYSHGKRKLFTGLANYLESGSSA